MQLQAESERIKRQKILESEGTRQSAINVAQGEKQSSILNGEGEAVKILNEAKAIVQSIEQVRSAIDNGQNDEGLKLKLTERYLEAMDRIMSDASIVMLPEGQSGSISRTLAEGMTLYKQLVGSGQAPQVPSASKLE